MVKPIRKFKKVYIGSLDGVKEYRRLELEGWELVSMDYNSVLMCKTQWVPVRKEAWRPVFL